MKLLLISLQSNAFITGVKYVAAKVRARGHEVRILFLPGYLEKRLDPAIQDFITRFNPDLIGISLMSIEFYPAKNLTRLLKTHFAIPIVWGGVHPVINPEECIEYADYVCIGEGEGVVVSLLDHLEEEGEESIPDIRGLWVNRNKEIIRQMPSPPVMNLDSLPHQEYLPEYFYGLHKGQIFNFADNEKLFRQYALYGGICHMAITSRGCPFTCSYCGNSSFIKVYGRKVRERSVANVIAELKDVKRNSFVLYINFQDDCFFAHNMEWIEDFRRQYKEHIGLPFVARGIPSMMDGNKLMMLRDAGLSWIVMGVQTGSDRVNYEIYDRKISFSYVSAASDMISRTRVAPFYEMIVDNPYETDDERIDTIRRMSGIRKPYILSLAHLTYFPGTPLTDRAVKDGVASSDAYLYTYMLKINKTYFNMLLGITPYIPHFMITYLNVPVNRQSTFRVILVKLFSFIIKRAVEPAVFLFLVTRSFDYKWKWTVRTVAGNWRSTLSRLVSSYLGKGDLEYDQKMALARKNMPELFRETHIHSS